MTNPEGKGMQNIAFHARNVIANTRHVCRNMGCEANINIYLIQKGSY